MGLGQPHEWRNLVHNRLVCVIVCADRVQTIIIHWFCMDWGGFTVASRGEGRGLHVQLCQRFSIPPSFLDLPVSVENTAGLCLSLNNRSRYEKLISDVNITIELILLLVGWNALFCFYWHLFVTVCSFVAHDFSLLSMSDICDHFAIHQWYLHAFD